MANSKIAALTALIKTLRYGTEIEFTGISRDHAAMAIAQVLPGSVVGSPDGYDHYETIKVTCPDGRAWSVMADGSVTGSSSNTGGELVSPILTWADMETLQAVVRALRQAGAKVNSSTGQHVHVDGAGFNTRPRGLVYLANMADRQDALLRRSLTILPERTRWAKRFSSTLLDRMQGAHSMRAVSEAWFAGSPCGCGSYRCTNSVRHGKYHGSRYHALNLYSFFYRGTVEFRHFNATLHAGEVKANICLALAMVAHCQSAGSISNKAKQYPQTKGHTNTWLKRMGLAGDEFVNVRQHLTKHLPGRMAVETVQAAPAPAAPAVRTTTMEQLINEEINRDAQPTLAQTIETERRQMNQAGGTDTAHPDIARVSRLADTMNAIDDINAILTSWQAVG